MTCSMTLGSPEGESEARVRPAWLEFAGHRGVPEVEDESEGVHRVQTLQHNHPKFLARELTEAIGGLKTGQC